MPPYCDCGVINKIDYSIGTVDSHMIFDDIHTYVHVAHETPPFQYCNRVTDGSAQFTVGSGNPETTVVDLHGSHS